MTATKDLRVLVLAEKPSVYLDLVHIRFPDMATFTCESYDDLPAALQEHRPTVVLAAKIGKQPFPRETLVTNPSVQWIQATSAGVDHLVPFGSDIHLTSARGVHDDVLADYVLCSILMFNLHFPTFFRQQQEREWNPRALEPTVGQCLVVLGLGSIGQLVAAKAKTLGMYVIGIRARRNAALLRTDLDAPDVVEGVEQLKEVVSQANYLAVTLPLTPGTRGLLSAEILSSMKTGSVLVNISRGGIVDEAALVNVLHKGPLRGAVFDVFENEPLPKDSKLWDAENLIITPHTGDIRGAKKRVAELFVKNLDLWQREEPLLNPVDPVRGY